MSERALEARVRTASAPHESTPRDLAAVFRREAGFVFRILRGLGVEDAVLDDLVQEVFVVALRRRSDWSRGVSERSWLYGIAKRVAANHRRRWRFRRSRLLPWGRARDVVVPRTPEDELTRQESFELILSFLATLPSSQREAFTQVDLEGMAPVEVAALQGVSVNTVYSRLRLAREQFRRHVARRLQREGSRS